MLARPGIQLDNDTKGKLISIGLHLLLLLLALWPFFRDSEWENETTVVIEFTETVASTDENKSSVDPDPKDQGGKENTRTEKAQKNLTTQGTNDPVNSPSTARDFVLEKESEIVAIEGQQSEGSGNRKDQRNNRDFGGLFGTSEGSENSSRSTDEQDLSALEVLSRGHGSSERGLTGRKVVYKPEILDRTQKEGRVVVEICVNKTGEVISAQYTQRGSNTTDSYLVELAENAAYKWRFTRSELPRQCGVITIDFRLE
ncbi:MAG: hypothetical protein R3275_03050 [Saprospiraceae bacterium]|nr:hypothetical protein [Saprospiraceae bacterium]